MIRGRLKELSEGRLVFVGLTDSGDVAVGLRSREGVDRKFLLSEEAARELKNMIGVALSFPDLVREDWRDEFPEDSEKTLIKWRLVEPEEKEK